MKTAAFTVFFSTVPMNLNAADGVTGDGAEWQDAADAEQPDVAMVTARKTASLHMCAVYHVKRSATAPH